MANFNCCDPVTLGDSAIIWQISKAAATASSDTHEGFPSTDLFEGTAMTTSDVVSSYSRRAALAGLLAVILAGCAGSDRPTSSVDPDVLVADARTTLSNFL